MLWLTGVTANLVLSLTARDFLVYVAIVLLSSCCASSFQNSLSDASTGISVNFHQVLGNFSKVIDIRHLNCVVLDFFRVVLLIFLVGLLFNTSAHLNTL